jgi:hypothetical protein
MSVKQPGKPANVPSGTKNASLTEPLMSLNAMAVWMLGVLRESLCRDMIVITMRAGYELMVANATNAAICCQTSSSVAEAAISTFVLDVGSIESRGRSTCCSGCRRISYRFMGNGIEWNGMEWITK